MMSCDSSTDGTTTTPGPVGLYDGVIPQGATWQRTITWQSGDPAALVDLTGFTARMDVKSTGQTTVSLTTENGRITLGGAAGTIGLELSAEITAAMGAATYLYDLELINGETVYRLLEGTLVVTPNITA